MSNSGQKKLERLVSNRSDILRILVDSAYTRRDLVERIECAESTLDRGLRNLENAGFVEYTDGKWKITHPGVRVYHQYDVYVRCLSDISDATPILASLDEESRLDVSFIRGSDTYEVDPAVPDSVLSPLFDSVRRATDVRGIVPKTLIGSVERFYEVVTTSDPCEIELCFADRVFERLYEDRSENITDAIRDSNTSFRHGSIPFSFALWIIDGVEASVVIYTETGIGGVLVNDTDDALLWATGQYESVRQATEPVTLANIDDITAR